MLKDQQIPPVAPHPYEPSPLMTEKDAVKFTGRSISTLQKDRFFRKGLPFIKIGRLVRYRLEETAQ